MYTKTENFNNSEERPKKTISSVLWMRFLKWLENTPFKKILHKILELILFCALFLLFTKPDIITKVLAGCWQGGNYLLPKMISCYLVVKNRVGIYRFCKRFKKPSTQNTVEGVPKDELLHFLFSTGGFKWQCNRPGDPKGAREKLGLSRKRYDRISSGLEKAGILTRGKNNSFVLGNVTREYAASAIEKNKISRPLEIFVSGKAQQNFKTTKAS